MHKHKKQLKDYTESHRQKLAVTQQAVCCTLCRKTSIERLISPLVFSAETIIYREYFKVVRPPVDLSKGSLPVGKPHCEPSRKQTIIFTITTIIIFFAAILQSPSGLPFFVECRSLQLLRRVSYQIPFFPTDNCIQ